MDLTIISRTLKITKEIEESIFNRFDFLDNLLNPSTHVSIKILTENDEFVTHISFAYNNQLVELKEISTELDSSVNLLSETVKKHLHRFYGFKYENFKHRESDIKSHKEKETGRIVKRKSFDMKPMSEKEAILHMNLLGHPSFMFCNADLDFITCLLYKRKDGNYGIIEGIFEEY